MSITKARRRAALRVPKDIGGDKGVCMQLANEILQPRSQAEAARALALLVKRIGLCADASARKGMARYCEVQTYFYRPEGGDELEQLTRLLEANPKPG